MKRKIIVTLLTIIAALCLCSGISACGDGNGTQKIAVTGVTLNKTELTLEVGREETLTATAAPDNATDKTVTWTTDKPEIASVDDNGKVTAKSAGTVVVTAKSGDKSATCTVTVVKPVKMTQEQWNAAIDATLSARNITLTRKDYDYYDGVVPEGSSPSYPVIAEERIEDMLLLDYGSGIVYAGGEDEWYAAEDDGVYEYRYRDGVWKKENVTEDYPDKDALFRSLTNFCEEAYLLLEIKSNYDACEWNEDKNCYNVHVFDEDWRITFKDDKVALIEQDKTVLQKESNDPTIVTTYTKFHNYGTTVVTLPEDAKNAVLAED